MTKIEVLGTGCSNCQRLAAVAEEAARELGIDYELVKVTDLGEIAARGVMMTPGLAVDGELRSTGRIPSGGELRTMLG